MNILSTLIAAGVLELREPTSEPDLSSTLAGRLPGGAAAESFGAMPLPKKLGRFEVDRLLGQGSMGAVLLAKDPAIDRGRDQARTDRGASHRFPARQVSRAVLP
jgi:hypothetical protein